MWFNKEYWNKSLTKTAILFITMYYKTLEEDEKREFMINNGYPDYVSLSVEGLNLPGFARLIE